MEDLKPQLYEHDILCLCETWLENGRPLVPSLPDNISVFVAPAVREASRGRAKGGLIIAINKDLFISQLVSSEPDLIVINFVVSRFCFLLILIYISPLTNIKIFLSKFNYKYCVSCVVHLTTPKL